MTRQAHGGRISRLILAGGAVLAFVLLMVAPDAGARVDIDGSSDAITATSGTIDFGDDELTTTGVITAGSLVVSTLDCSGDANGGALTANASGIVACSDDDGGGGGGVILLTGSGSLNDASQERFGMFGQTNQQTEERATYVLPRGGTLRNLFVKPTASIDSGSVVTIAVRVNGVDTALAVTHDFADGATVQSNTADSVAVSQGNEITIHYASNATDPGAGSNYNTTLELQ